MHCVFSILELKTRQSPADRCCACLQVSIVPRGSAALGFAQYLPSENLLMTTEQMRDMTCMALGGRAAEQVLLGKISTGARTVLWPLFQGTV